MKARTWFGLTALAAVSLSGVVWAAPAPAPQADGEALFQAHCKMCHEPALDRAPTRTDMAQRSAVDLSQILTNGPMQPMAADMTPDQIKALSTYMSRDRVGGNPLSAENPNEAAAARPAAAGGRNAGPPPPPTKDVMCASNPPLMPGKSDWTSWGIDDANTHYQKAGGLKAADVPKLKLKWAFSIRGGSYSQPTVLGDWLFFVVRGDGFYAIDAKTGCVHWHLPDVTSRTTPAIIKSNTAPSGYMTVVGVANRQVQAYDLQDGKALWTSPSLEDHKSAGITGSPIVSGNQVFVPLTSGEEGAGTQPTYRCCSFRGSVVSLDLATGKPQWKTYVITEPMHDLGKNPQGTVLQGPAGGAIWSAPTVDAKKGIVYVATGDSYTTADTKGDDAIVAMDMKTGKIKWSTQVTKDDNFIVGCTQINHSVNCPDPGGPDYDFGNPPIIFKLASGKQVILSGQKSGIAYGMDADTGKVLWKTGVGTGGSLGGIEWGMAADDKRLYVPNSDIIGLMDEYRRPRGEALLSVKPPPSKPGLTALDPATGKVIWHVDAPKAPCKYFGDRSRDRTPNSPCLNAQSAAITVIPGAVFSGTADGWFRAYDPATGKIIWEYSTTAQQYDTLNGIKNQPGGGIDSMGPVVAGGVVYTFSGYGGAANTGGNPRNVLLAFSVDGK
jgi:polyvinyl alcohol dehydrogenase (cytochrome)